MKKAKRLTLLLIVVIPMFLTNCGEDSSESVILGTWLATSVVREDCGDPLDNGALNCRNILDQCVSCLELVLNRDGSYSLSANFDLNPISETGTYEAKNSVISLAPVNDDAYDLPISNVSSSNMTIDLPLSNGCTANIALSHTDC